MGARRQANKAVRAASRRLKGEASGSIRVDSVSWDGAVDIDPANAVVWILLSGAPDDELPKWYFPVPGQEAGIQVHLDVRLRGWLDQLREVVHEEFAKVAWPNPMAVDVGFDSTHRVESEGGYAY